MSTLMTVPSCVEHNTEKSNADEYLKFILTSTSGGVPREVIDRTARAITRLMKKKSRSLGKYGFSEVHGSPSTYTTDGTAPVDILLIQETLVAIARAVYHYDSGKSKKLTSKMIAMPLFLGPNIDCSEDWRMRFLQIDMLTTRDFIDRPVCGANQDIFAYQVIEEDGIVLVNMRFYREQLACVIAQR